MQYLLMLFFILLVSCGTNASEKMKSHSKEINYSNLPVTKYIPLVLIGKYPDDVSKLNIVDEQFIKNTVSWNNYKNFVNDIAVKEEKLYIDKDIKQTSLYASNELILVKTFRISGGLIKSQYYKAGDIFLILTATNHDGKFDIKEYFHDGILKFTEYVNGINEDNIARWYSANTGEI